MSMYSSVRSSEITDMNRILLSRIQSKRHMRKLGISRAKQRRIAVSVNSDKGS